MDEPATSPIKVFFTGVGLRTMASFVPPCAVAWAFFLLFLGELQRHDPERFWLALVLGLAAILLGSGIVVWLIL